MVKVPLENLDRDKAALASLRGLLSHSNAATPNRQMAIGAT